LALADSDAAAKLTPPTPRDLAFALRLQGRKRVHNADEIMRLGANQAPAADLDPDSVEENERITRLQRPAKGVRSSGDFAKTVLGPS
jgi:hypothetical protein